MLWHKALSLSTFLYRSSQPPLSRPQHQEFHLQRFLQTVLPTTSHVMVQQVRIVLLFERWLETVQWPSKFSTVSSYSSEWVNSTVKQRLSKAFALHHADIRTKEQFKSLLQNQLDQIAEELKDSNLFFANLSELQKAADLWLDSHWLEQILISVFSLRHPKPMTLFLASYN